MGLKLVLAEPRKDLKRVQMCTEQKSPGCIADIVDASDPDFRSSEGRLLGSAQHWGPGVCRSHYQLQLRGVGNAMDQVVRALAVATKAHGKIGLLRFHGHGYPGFQFLCSGRELSPYFLKRKIATKKMTADQANAVLKAAVHDPKSRIAISAWNLRIHIGSLLTLSPLLAPGAEVWLMGCNVGGGAKGRKFVDDLAFMLGTTVKAGSQTQFGTHEPTYNAVNFTHEGPIVVGSPIVDPWAKR